MNRHYLVVDLEATCDRTGWNTNDGEIIEIGAVLVDGDQLAPIDEFQTFVRPLLRPQLTAFCTELTHIQQADVDAAPLFPEAIAQMARWIAGRPVLLSSWGAYDRNQFSRERRRHKVKLPWDKGHLNIKQAFAERALSLRSVPEARARVLRAQLRPHSHGPLARSEGTQTRPMGMAQALTRAGLPLIGTHHRGIDDARNIARLLPFALGRQSLPSEQGQIPR